MPSPPPLRDTNPIAALAIFGCRIATRRAVGHDEIQGSAQPLRKGKYNHMVTQRRLASRDGAEALAIQALSFIAAAPERLGNFLATSGIGPDQIREAASEPHFLAGVLDHLASDERLLLAFASEAGIDPSEIERARHALGSIPHD